MWLPTKMTSGCIWISIPVDWVILHWYPCDADRQSVRCTDTWLPKFVGWVDYHIFLRMVLCCTRFEGKRFAMITMYIFTGCVYLEMSCACDFCEILTINSGCCLSHSPNSTIHLDFEEFATECNWDHLYIYDGKSIKSPLIGVIR